MVLDDPKALDEIFISKKCAWLYYVGRLNQNQIAKKGRSQQDARTSTNSIC
jgi:DNA-binding transcriptional regulator LsrR (DeoR family)